MNIPSLQNPIWKAIILEQKKISFHFLAAKILLARAKMEAKRSPEKLPLLVIELHGLLAKNSNLPSVQQDLKKIQE